MYKYYLFVADIIKVTATMAIPMPTTMLVVSGSPKSAIKKRSAPFIQSLQTNDYLSSNNILNPTKIQNITMVRIGNLLIILPHF